MGSYWLTFDPWRMEIIRWFLKLISYQGKIVNTQPTAARIEWVFRLCIWELHLFTKWNQTSLRLSNCFSRLVWFDDNIFAFNIVMRTDHPLQPASRLEMPTYCKHLLNYFCTNVLNIVSTLSQIVSFCLVNGVYSLWTGQSIFAPFRVWLQKNTYSILLR